MSATAGSAETPCVRVCAIDAGSGLCRGCLRSLDEIAGWAVFSAEERRAVMQELPARRAALAGKDD